MKSMKSPRDLQDDLPAARLALGLRVGVPILVVMLAVVAGAVRGTPLAVLVLAAGALTAVIGLFWQSVRTLVGETSLSGADAFALGTPHVEEERKRAVLRALKDLEFERSVGKISEEDYRELVAHYRLEAKRLLRTLDAAAQPRRDRVVGLVEARLRAAGLAGGLEEARTVASEPAPSASEEEAAPATVDADAPPPPSAAPFEAPRACPACATVNDPDAAFCKKCAAPLRHAAEPAAVAAPAAGSGDREGEAAP